MTSLRQEIRQNRPFASAEQETVLNLVRTVGILDGPLRGLLRRESLGVSLYNILRILRGQQGEPLSCSAIGERLVTRVPDVTRLIERLARRGLVERRRCPQDGRKVLITLSDRGAGLLARLDEPVLVLHREMLGHLTRQEMKTLNELLTKTRRPHLAADIPAEGDRT
ncbi:MarR family transcriptional regulator [bacterium]|nr:MarR family transcriptional regulator [bacterium]